jgi:hypothetical protein
MDARDYFKPGLTAEEREVLFSMLANIEQRLTDRSWFLYGGALIGCLLFGDLLPWDDDIDIVMDSLRALRLPPHKVATKFPWKEDPQRTTMKCYDPKRQRVGKYEYTFPFIDFSIFYEEGDEVKHKSVYGGIIDTFPREVVFPLKKVRFGSAHAFIPNDSDRMLKAKYGEDWATTVVPPVWDHRHEVPTGFPQERFGLWEVL